MGRQYGQLLEMGDVRELKAGEDVAMSSSGKSQGALCVIQLSLVVVVQLADCGSGKAADGESGRRRQSGESGPGKDQGGEGSVAPAGSRVGGLPPGRHPNSLLQGRSGRK